MKNLIIITFLLYLPINIYCQNSIKLDSIQAYNFKNSDIVFLGEVIKIDTMMLTCEMKIYEIFKGNNPGTVSFIISTGYTFIPEPAGLWIIYAKKINETTYTVSDRSISRSNLNPDRISYYLPKPPPRRKENQRTYSIEAINIKIKALTEWNTELYKLRNKLIK